MQKPTGVVILAILSWIFAAFLLIPALALFLGSSFIATMIGHQFGPIAAFAGVIGGAICLFIALVTAVVAWGLWNLQEWARILTIIFSGIFLALGILGMFALAFFHPVGVIFRLVRVAVNGVIIWYLMQPEVVAAFKRPAAA
jgi:uncharacterized membrane protein (DUF2068 family)